MDYRGTGNLLYLPLDKLMQQSASGASSSSSSSSSDGQASSRAAPEQQPADSNPRSRDSFRSRERPDR
jgi:membrane protease subunit HflK